MRCAVEVAAIRAAPSETSEQVTQALLREPLDVAELAGAWARIVTVYGYDGWIRREALEDADGELPPASEQTALQAAYTFLGAPYLWGGLTAAGIDCSGLVHMAYRLSGRLVPRDAWQQEEAGRRVAQSTAAPGDLITYGTGERADHIAFWAGETRILHATGRNSLGVVEEPEPEDMRASRRVMITF